MGFNLNRLMRQYGLATPTMAQYTGEMGPDVDIIDEDENSDTFGNVIGVTPGTLTFDPAKQAEFDDYQNQYQFRLSNRPMYESSQFRTTPSQEQPQTYEDMFTMYLGRSPGDGETNRGPVSDAQRNQFLATYADEFADLGINNTGNQLVADQIGNYYGNILRNPDFNSTPSNSFQADPSAPFIERNPSVVNPNPPFTGPVMTVDQAYYDPDNPPVVDGEVTDNFLQFANQQDQILANLANPLPDESITTIEDARNVDPFASSSSGGPSYGAYLAKNQDVLKNITGFDSATGSFSGTPQPGYAALNIPVGGFAAGTPEDLAVQQYVAQAAKNHFVNHGFLEGRKFYKTGGEVKGYQLGGGYTPFGVSEEDVIGVTSNAGLGDVAETIVEEDVDVVGTRKDMVDTLIAAAPRVENLYDETMVASEGFNNAQTDFNATVQDIISSRNQGPDKAELYFKLAAAFAQPTKSKNFGFLENVPSVLADYAKDNRQARKQGQQMEITLAKSKLAQAKTKYDSLQNKRTKQAESYRTYMMELYKIIADKDKVAADQLLKRKKFDYDKKTLPPELIKIKLADEDGLKDLNDGLKELRKGLSKNKSAGPSDEATMLKIRGKQAYGNLSKEQLATLEVMNIIGAFSVKQLKNTFGAQLSDGERKVFFSLMGSGNYPTAKMREMIIGRLIKQTVKTINQKRQRLKRINSGTYRFTEDDLTLGGKAKLSADEEAIIARE